MKRVLVFPCGSEVGLELGRALANSSHFMVFGASSVPDHGRFAYSNYLEGLPNIEDREFIARLNEVITEHAIDFVLPAHDSVVLKLAQHQESLRAVVVTSPASTCEVCRSKAKTYRMFAGIVPVPRIYEDHDPTEFPVFLKPDVGQGSRGVYKAANAQEVAFHTAHDPSLLKLEYLPGAEYTIDCFTDRRGDLLFAAGRERRRIQGGISVNSVEVHDPRFLQLADSINRTLTFRGAWFFQVKARADDELVLMEIAPRIAGTMGLFRVDGVNFAQLSLFDRMGVEVEVMRNDLPLEVDRALAARFRLGFSYNSVYVDLDDTLIVQGRVNTTLVAFLYQVRNERKRVILLSRHRHDVLLTLRAAAISEHLFDEVRVIGDTAPKSEFIERSDAIFIDDSFAERLEVSRRLRIPVFSLDAVEGLLA